MTFCREKNQKLLFKVDSLFNFRKWFMYGLKAQKFQKHHALKGQKPYKLLGVLKLLPLQGAKFANMITLGAALG